MFVVLENQAFKPMYDNYSMPTFYNVYGIAVLLYYNGMLIKLLHKFSLLYVGAKAKQQSYASVWILKEHKLL